MRPRMAVLVARWIAGAVCILCLAGCGVVGPRSTSPSDFYTPSTPPAADVRSPNDQGGWLVSNGGEVRPAPAVTTPETQGDVTISRTVLQASTQPAATLPPNGSGPGSPGVAATTSPATQISEGGLATSGTTPAGATTVGASNVVIGDGQYMVVGAVVCSVNNTPIYANKVVAFLEPILRAAARNPDMTPEVFRDYAYGQIQDEVRRQVDDELLYTAAMRNLNDDEKNRARGLTTQWYERQITEAGGSLELARQRAAASGISFDDLTQRMYRQYVRDMYLQLTLYPRINVTAQMMRDYYATHVGSDFTKYDHADFYVIEVSPAATLDSGDQQARSAAALEKIQHLRALVAGGEPFRAVAASSNDDPSFRASAADSRPYSMDRHAFKIDEVDAAVFSLQPKQVSDVISAQGNYYLVEVEARTIGRVLPFDDPTVQDTIDSVLRRQQFSVLQSSQIDKLRDQAAVSPDPDFQSALQMVMQNYPVWRGK